MTGTLTSQAGAAATRLTPYHAEAVAEAAKPVLAANSIAVYGAMIAKLDAWTARHGYPRTMPADQSVIAAWLLDMAEAGTAVSSIDVALAAVRWTHEQAGHPFTRSPALNNTLKRIRREHAKTPDQAAPLKGDMLRDMLVGAGSSRLALRDAAMLALAYVFALRRSELAAIDLAPSANGNGLALTADALVLTIRRSKTSQEAPETVAVPRAANPRAVGAVERWIREAAIEPGTPLLRSISPGGSVRADRLTADMASRAMKRAVARYLIGTGMDEGAARAEAKRYGGHSGRVGFITSAVEHGARHEDIAKVSRHRSGSKMIGRYSAQADQLRTAPHRIAGVGV